MEEEFNALDLSVKPNQIPPTSIDSPCLNFGQSAETVVPNMIKKYQQHTFALRLPQKFTGDPVKYTSFMKAIEAMVEKNVDDPVPRLQHLITSCPCNLVMSS